MHRGCGLRFLLLLLLGAILPFPIGLGGGGGIVDCWFDWVSCVMRTGSLGEGSSRGRERISSHTLKRAKFPWCLIAEGCSMGSLRQTK